MAPSQEINIPQKPPMVMIDRIIEIREKTTVTALLVREDNLFCENGLFREPGLIENMAQTAAAGAGARPDIGQGEAPAGFIGAVKDLMIQDLPRTGDEILTTATVVHEIFDASIVEATIRLHDRIIASCELKIFLVREPHE